jgi:hypothetical protein
MPITLAHRRPRRVNLDTLCIICRGSGEVDRGENHSTYAKWVGTIVSGEGNTLAMAALGIWKITRTCATRGPIYPLITVKLEWKSHTFIPLTSLVTPFNENGVEA